MDVLLKRILDEMTSIHGCHTVILYGSRARGDWTAESDYDLIGFRSGGDKFRDARILEGKYVDVFIYPESDAELSSLFHVRGGKVLVERDEFGSRLLAKAEEKFAKGPDPIPKDELDAQRVWVAKMLARAEKGDPEGNFRRAWLQFSLLESYFQLRELWYLGPKESFRWLEKNDPEAYAAFEAALAPGATLDSLRALTGLVLS